MKEAKRQQAIRRYRILDSESEAMFDDIVALAVYIFNAEFALVSLSDEDRQWFKSTCGIQISEAPRDTSFCTFVVQSGQTLIVEDAKVDPRFHDHPNVKAGAQVSFYVGAPLITPTGEVIGSLCVAGLKPNTASPSQIEALERLARQVINLMEARLINLERGDAAQCEAMIAAISKISNQAQKPEQAIEACLQKLQELEFESPGIFKTAQSISLDHDQGPINQKRRSIWCCLSRDIGFIETDSGDLLALCPVYTQKKWLGIFEFRLGGSPRPATLRILNHLCSEIAHVLERSLAEESLELQSNFLSAVLDNLTDGIVACDSAGKLTIFNRATREFHGLTEEDINQDNWANYYSLFGPDGKSPLQLSEIPLYRTLSGESIKDVEIVIAPRSSPARSVLCTGRPLTDKNGQSLGAVIAMNDVTARKQIIAELESAKQKLELRVEDRTAVLNLVMESIPQIVWQADLQGAITFMNSKWYELTGAPKESFIWDFIHEDDRELAREEINSVSAEWRDLLG